MEGGPPIFRQDGSCPALLEDMDPGFLYGAVTRSGPPFQTVRVPKTHATGLVRVRSPLLAESRLMSFPPATEMFQFAGFASPAYGFSRGYRLRGGLPHSEIPGSTIARISPGLFAACHVLHRLSVPRHPPDALMLRLSATPSGKERHQIRQSTKIIVWKSPQSMRFAGRFGPCFAKTGRAAFARANAGPPSVTSQLAIHNVTSINTRPREDGKPLSRRSMPRLPRSLPQAPEVEVIGIEPTTSCLQSRRSPN